MINLTFNGTAWVPMQTPDPVSSTAAVPVASPTTPGIVKVGSGLTIDGSGLLVAASAVTASPTVAGVVKVGSGLTIDGGGNLANPYVYRGLPIWIPPAYSYTGMAAALNAAMTAAVSAGYNGLYIAPGRVYCDVPVTPPSGFSLFGLGRMVPFVPGETYSGGVKFIGPYGGASSALQIVGTGSGATVSTSGVLNVTIENIAFVGLYVNADVFSQTNGPVPLVSVTQGYKLVLRTVSFSADYGQVLRLINCWDCEFWDTTISGGGCCDPTVTADSATVQGYTGRSFMASETAVGRSFGVPAIEIISPNVTGGDVSNNLDFYAFHREGNGTNGVGIIIRGGNGNNIRFATGSKIECDDGCVPLLVLQDQNNVDWNGILYGAGSGSAPNTVGSIAAGTPWRNYNNPGLIVAHNCASVRISGSVGYNGYGSSGSQATAPLAAFARFIACLDPQINVGVTSGLDSLLAGSNYGRVILDGCTDVSVPLTRAYASAYLKSLPHANTVERASINGTTYSDVGNPTGVTTVDGTVNVGSVGTPYQMLMTDRTVNVSKTTGAATSLLLPPAPFPGVPYLVVDGKGDASTNTITISGAGVTINGASTYVLNVSRGTVSLVAVNATTWSIT